MAKADEGAPFSRVLIHNVMSPINLGMILRVAETFRAEVHIFDPGGVFGDEGKLKTISDFACGALQRRPPHVFVDEAEIAVLAKSGRLVATSIEPSAEALPSFRWRAGDIVVFGNEYDGLPEIVAANAGAHLTIPMPEGYAPKPASHSPIDPTRTAPVSNDGKPNLNVAMSVGIVAYSAYLAATRRRAVASARAKSKAV